MYDIPGTACLYRPITQKTSQTRSESVLYIFIHHSEILPTSLSPRALSICKEPFQKFIQIWHKPCHRHHIFCAASCLRINSTHHFWFNSYFQIQSNSVSWSYWTPTANIYFWFESLHLHPIRVTPQGVPHRL